MSKRVWLRFCSFVGGIGLPFALLGCLLCLLTGYGGADRFVDLSLARPQSDRDLTIPAKLASVVAERVVIAGDRTFTNVHIYTQGLLVAGQLTVTGKLTVANSLTVSRGLRVVGSVDVTGGLKVGVVGEAAVSTRHTITGGLLVTNVQTWVGGLTVLGRLTVPITGELTVIGGLLVTDEVRVAGKLHVRPFTFYLPLVAQNVIIEADNGGFERGPAQWDEYSATNQPLILPAPSLGVPPHAGNWAASFGRRNDEISMISQSIAITRTNSCLLFWQWTVADDVCNADYGGVGINGKWVDIQSLCAGTSTARWTLRHVDMKAHIVGVHMGATVLNFAVVNDYSVPSTMYIDDIAFYPPSVCAASASSSLHVAQEQDVALRQLIGQPIASHPPRVPK